MEIDDKLIDKLADLARLKFEGEEREQIKKDFSRMLGFVQKLEKIDTSNVEPLVYMTNEYLTLRKDEVTDELTQQQALKNSPIKDSDYFKVPKVLDKN